MNARSDRNLLFGILALQNDFITRDQLVEAVHAWVSAKHRALGDLLRERGALDAEAYAALEALLAAYLARHGGAADQGLQALSATLSGVRQALASVADADVQGSLAALVGADPDRTTSVVTGSGDGMRYRVLRPHARGGLGEVFVAEDAELHREVALKEIQARFANDDASRERFLREAEITGRLEHPGIVPVYGLGSYGDGRPFYAMRLVQGDNLKTAIAAFHQSGAGFDALAFRQLLGRFMDVCNAVAYAHSRGVLHRDLKPGNVMLGHFGETLVVDWGLAKVVGHHESANGGATLELSSGSGVRETVAGTTLGTPAYMSPEQAHGKLDELGPATDVYSLGGTLYCLLTGQSPVPGDHVVEVLEKVRRGDIVPPRRVRADVPRPLEAVCRKAMAPRPEDRYASPLELAADLEHWLADEPVSAYREPWTTQAARWARKRKTLVVSTAAVLLVGLIAAAVGLVVVGGLNRQLEAANAQLADNNRQLEAARLEAEDKRREAERERNTAVAVNDFLQNDLLGQADIAQQAAGKQGERDPNITVAELLDRAARTVAEKFPNQPATEAALRLTIGNTYRALGRYDQARPHLERSAALRAEKLGPDHPDTLISQHDLAALYQAQGEYDRAEPLFRQVVRQRERQLGPDHADTLESKNSLAGLYHAQGKDGQAEPLFREVHQKSERLLGPDHPLTLSSTNNLATLTYLLGKLDQAEPLFRQVRQQRTRLLGADHPDTLRSTNNLAFLYQARQKYDQAEPLYRDVLRQREQKLGPDHPDTLLSKNNLGFFYQARGKYDRAEPLFEEVLRRREQKLGPDHPDTLLSKNNLAGVFQMRQQFDRAEPLFQEVLRRREQKLGPDHADTLVSKSNLAQMYRDQGKFDRAEPLLTEAVAAAQKTLGTTHPHTQIFLRNLAALYEQEDKPEKAEPLWRQRLDAVKAQAGADSLPAAEALGELGQNLLRQKKYADAEPVLRAGYDGLKQRADQLPPALRQVRLGEAAERLVKLYDAWGKPDEAKRWQAERDALRPPPPTQ